jgi:hypothetical protein
MEDVGIFYGYLVHFTVFCYILWTFDIVRGNLVTFSRFWYFAPRKIWQPCRGLMRRVTQLQLIYHIQYSLQTAYICRGGLER